MTIRIILAAIALTLGGCATRPSGSAAGDPIEVGIIAINDLHGNLQPPRLSVQAAPAGGAPVAVPAGGAAYLASAVDSLRRAHPHAITVGAGDLTGASPLASSLFLDEPTVAALNAMGLDLNAAGNHEFDRGTAELLRLQNGGCDRHVLAAPCQLERFAGAKYRYLAGNTVGADGRNLLPGTAIRSFGQGARKVTIGFIGLTTRTTGSLVSPTSIAGISFPDEAASANALVPGLRKAGADAIVLLIHEGGYPKPETDPNACEGLSGPIRSIVDQLDPAITTVVSGHTHKAYVCDYRRGDAAPSVLLTSAGRYGTLVTDLTLRFDPRTRRLVGQSARNVIVQGEGYTTTDGMTVSTSPAAPRFAADPAVAAIVTRYVGAAETMSKRVIGRLTRVPRLRSAEPKPHESQIGNLIADAQLAATSAPDKGGAQVAFMNSGGIRADLKPATPGAVTFGDIYAVQPFGNTLAVREYTGAQLRAILEQQFTRPSGTNILSVAGLTYAFDRSRPAGQRVRDVKVAGKPLDGGVTYRAALSNFLSTGGDEFVAFTAGRDVAAGGLDVDALAAHFARQTALTPPATDRIADLTPAGWKAPT